MKLSEIFLSGKPKHQAVAGIVTSIALCLIIYLLWYVMPALKSAPVSAPPIIKQWQIKKMDGFFHTDGTATIPVGWELAEIVPYSSGVTVIYIKRLVKK